MLQTAAHVLPALCMLNLCPLPKEVPVLTLIPEVAVSPVESSFNSPPAGLASTQGLESVLTLNPCANQLQGMRLLRDGNWNHRSQSLGP